jgi:hypothetical protein
VAFPDVFDGDACSVDTRATREYLGGLNNAGLWEAVHSRSWQLTKRRLEGFATGETVYNRDGRRSSVMETSVQASVVVIDAGVESYTIFGQVGYSSINRNNPSVTLVAGA